MTQVEEKNLANSEVSMTLLEFKQKVTMFWPIPSIKRRIKLIEQGEWCQAFVITLNRKPSSGKVVIAWGTTSVSVEWALIYPSSGRQEEGSSGATLQQTYNWNQDHSLSASNVTYFWVSGGREIASSRIMMRDTFKLRWLHGKTWKLFIPHWSNLTVKCLSMSRQTLAVLFLFFNCWFRRARR